MIDDIKWVLTSRPEFMGGHKILMIKSNNEWIEVRTESRFEKVETSTKDCSTGVEESNDGEPISAN